MEAAEDSAAPGPDAPPAVAPAPPKRAGVFSAMMDAQKRQKAADAAKAKEPLPKPKPRGPAPKGLDGQGLTERHVAVDGVVAGVGRGRRLTTWLVEVPHVWGVPGTPQLKSARKNLKSSNVS